MKEKKIKLTSVALLLQDIRSVHNVGSIFRTAECLGITQIYLSGTTPTPIDRFERKRQDFAKVSLGAEDMVKWIYLKDPIEFIEKFKEQGIVIALEQDERSIDYKEVHIPTEKEILIIIGNEVDGVSMAHLDRAHIIAEIPQAGEKESLNVSIATGIALYRWFDRKVFLRSK